ncbi:MAG: hypothetical protein WBO24_12695 [Nitrospirales bacterium]
MVIAGFRPGSRSTFVSAKVDKAIDAQFGHIGWNGRAEEERTNLLRSNKARRKQRASDPRAEQQASEFRMEKQIFKKQALEIILNDYKAPMGKNKSAFRSWFHPIRASFSFRNEPVWECGRPNA